MSTQRRRRRGTAAQHAGFTGAEGEITVVTGALGAEELRLHNGTTAGGVPIARADLGNVSAVPVAKLPVGSTAGTVCAGDDARLGNARTPTAHTHPASEISDSSTTGRAVLTAADQAAARSAIGSQVAGSYAASVHTHPASEISDSSATGRAVLTATDQAAARSVLGLGSLATQSGTFSGTSSGTNTGDQNVFTTIAVSGQSNVVADAASDTLTLVAGSNVTITTNAATDTITIAATGGGGGTPAGANTQIQYNASGAFGASSNFTYTPGTSGGMRIDSGHVLIGGALPSNHSAAGFFSIYFAGNQAAAFCPDTGVGFEGLTMSSNRVRGGSGWVAQSTGTIWSLTIGHGSSVNAFSIDHATSTTSGSAPGSNYQNVFLIDNNRRASFGQQAFGTYTSPISAKLSVVNATATDVVLVARAASGQSANIFETRDASNNPLTTIATTGALTVRQNSSTVRIQTDGTGIGFFGVTPVARPAVTGSRGGNAALASLLTQLASLGLITDSTTA
ncbi:MAG: hypothetical protein IOD15_00290 [Phycisphaerales bacterium]|nr:hypothetical protein [Phycisphaerales bacterium]